MPLNNLEKNLPPRNEEAEQATLGALLLNFNPDALETVSRYLHPDDFYNSPHQKIFKAIMELAGNGQVDILTVSEYLRGQGVLEQAGGAAYLARLTDKVPTSANIEYYARVVKENSVRRRLIKTASDLSVRAYDQTRETRIILEEAEMAIFEINDQQDVHDFKSAREIIQTTMESVEHRYKSKETYSGVPSGLTPLDDLTTGFHDSEMVIIGARPSVGKTAFATTLASNIAVRSKIPCGFFTLEMSASALMERVLAAEARVDAMHMKTGMLRPAELQALMEASGRIYEAPLYIDDTSNIKLLDLRSQARRMKNKHGIEILFIDYIGLVTYEEPGVPRHEQIAAVSRSLKSLARELEIPVVVLSQVGRQTEGKAPGLADLRESGAIEQDADVVMFLHRDRGIERNGQEAPVGNIETELIIAKQRNGPVGKIRVAFLPQYTRFETMTQESP